MVYTLYKLFAKNLKTVNQWSKYPKPVFQLTLCKNCCTVAFLAWKLIHNGLQCLKTDSRSKQACVEKAQIGWTQRSVPTGTQWVRKLASHITLEVSDNTTTVFLNVRFTSTLVSSFLFSSKDILLCMSACASRLCISFQSSAALTDHFPDHLECSAA